MPAVNGRQVSPTLDGIKANHLARYRFAANFARTRELSTAIDLGCGAGYGSWVLATSGRLQVNSFDISDEALNYARKHYAHENVVYEKADLNDMWPPECDLSVAFEVIEHFNRVPRLLRRIKSRYLIGSVPNEEVIPFDARRHKYHFKHYTPREIESVLARSGWKIRTLCGQKKDAVLEGTDGMSTIVFVAMR